MLSLFAFIACSSEPKPIAKLGWLEGNWKMQTDKFDMLESWKIKGDTLWGAAYYISGTDSTLAETIFITVNKDGRANFHAAVEGQNAGKEVVFKESMRKEQELVFTNPAHDFPQRIEYRRKGDSLIASVSGMMEGVARTMYFRYKRQ